jgi:hypothetical protein
MVTLLPPAVITLLHGFTCICIQCWDSFIINTCPCIFFSPLYFTFSLPNASIVNEKFIFQFTSKSLTYRNLTRPFRSLKNAQNSLWEADHIFKKLSLWMWSLAKMEQFSFWIISRTSQQTGPGQCNRYSNSLWTGRSAESIPGRARFSAPVQTSPGAHPASYTMGTWSFPGVKLPGCGTDYPPTYSTEVEERVELYLYSTSGPSCPVIGLTLALPSQQTWNRIRALKVCAIYPQSCMEFFDKILKNKYIIW